MAGIDLCAQSLSSTGATGGIRTAAALLDRSGSPANARPRRNFQPTCTDRRAITPLGLAAWLRALFTGYKASLVAKEHYAVLGCADHDPILKLPSYQELFTWTERYPPACQWLDDYFVDRILASRQLSMERVAIYDATTGRPADTCMSRFMNACALSRSASRPGKSLTFLLYAGFGASSRPAACTACSTRSNSASGSGT